MAQAVQHRLYVIFLPDQNGSSVTRTAKSDSSADDFLLRALGEDDAPGVCPHDFHGGIQSIGGRVKSAGQAASVAAKIIERPACDTRIHRGFGDGRWNTRDQAGIEDVRNDIFGS